MVFSPLYVVAAVMITGALAHSTLWTGVLAWLFVALFIAILVAERRKTRLWAFVAGAITGILLLPLVGVIGLLIVCGGMRI